jgi:hypothetical protein
VENGVYNILVWQGKGSFGGYDIKAFDFGKDELLVCHNRAVDSVVVENTGNQDLIIFKFFGPDINPQVPMLKKYPKC